MEKMQVQQWWRSVKSRLSYKNATIIVCLFNTITVVLLLQGFFFSSSSSNIASSNKALQRHIKECEEIRRAMVPVDLIRRVREITEDEYVGIEEIEAKDVKQTAAMDLVSRLNNYRSYSDSGSTKALEEWRKRKMERARQRSVGKNGTSNSES
ncbi:hypothetical protein ABFX02_07G054000 [Erythranthe guttata]